MNDNIIQDNLIPAEAQSNLETVAMMSDPVSTKDCSAANVKHVYVFGDWQSNAARLAEFCFTRLVNRSDAYGKYRPIHERDGKNTALTVRESVTLEVLQEHFQSRDHNGLIGLHSNSQENTSRWMVIDIDHHGPPDPDAHDLNKSFAVEIFEYLAEAGMKPLLYASNGQGGYNVWLIFQEPVSSADARRLGLAIAHRFKNDGLPNVPEVFPKQDQVSEGGLGNWVRLPGLHHTREFHTQVWDGQAWLDGEDAIELICEYEPVSANVLQAHIADLPVIEQTPPVADLPDSDDETRPIHHVLRKLKSVQREGIGYKACCPAHGDSNPSLSIREKEDGKVLIHCFAGCETEEILAKIDLGLKDLFPPLGFAATNLMFRMITPHIEEEKPVGRMADLQEEYTAVMEDQHYEDLKDELGFDPDSVRSLGIGWCAEDETWTYPEKDAEGRIIGIFKRSSDGKKSMVPGSKRGLFIPEGFDPLAEHIFITEGATDTVAALSEGLNAVGRPSAGAGTSELARILKDSTGVIYVIYDNDMKRDGTWPGLVGAQKVAEALAAELRAKVKLTSPPMQCKDLRDFCKTLVESESEVQYS